MLSRVLVGFGEAAAFADPAFLGVLMTEPMTAFLGTVRPSLPTAVKGPCFNIAETFVS